MTEPERIAQLADAVRLYLGEHPSAADTLAGIHRWWLNDVALEFSPRELRLALETLVANRVVTKNALPDGSEVYTATSNA